MVSFLMAAESTPRAARCSDDVATMPCERLTEQLGSPPNEPWDSTAACIEVKACKGCSKGSGSPAIASFEPFSLCNTAF
jgi:hypothetical protein